MPSPVDELSFADLVSKFSQLVDQKFTCQVPISFGPALGNSEGLPALGVKRAIRFPANFSGSLFNLLGGPPSVTTVLTINCYGAAPAATLGTITVNPNGSYTARTTNEADVVAGAGNFIQLVGPIAGTNLNNFAGLLVGTLVTD